jgi:hypothetical protein
MATGKKGSIRRGQSAKRPQGDPSREKSSGERPRPDTPQEAIVKRAPRCRHVTDPPLTGDEDHSVGSGSAVGKEHLS